jgi:hypothetical protein
MWRVRRHVLSFLTPQEGTEGRDEKKEGGERAKKLAAATTTTDNSEARTATCSCGFLVSLLSIDV